MRIALIITELDPGGAELCLTELALYLAQHGHCVSVWCIGSPPPQGREQLVDRLALASIEVQFGRARRGLDAFRVARWLRQELAQFQPDIVQSMLWHANVLTAAALWGKPAAWIAGMRVSEPRAGRWWLERLASRRMQRMVCVSREVQQHAHDKERIAADKLVVIPNGLSQRCFDYSPPTDRPSPIQPPPLHSLIFVGRLEPQKGVSALIEHMDELLTGHDQWDGILVGHGSLRSAIESQLKSLGLERRVHMVGWQADALGWIYAADVLLLPAEYEGMPNVLLEAMALGKPFVAFAVDGVGQLLDAADGYPAELAAAQLVAPGDWPEFVRRVRALMASAELRGRCGQANRSHASGHFRLEDQLQKYLQLYHACIRQ